MQGLLFSGLGDHCPLMEIAITEFAGTETVAVYPPFCVESDIEEVLIDCPSTI